MPPNSLWRVVKREICLIEKIVWKVERVVPTEASITEFFVTLWYKTFNKSVTLKTSMEQKFLSVVSG